MKDYNKLVKKGCLSFIKRVCSGYVGDLSWMVVKRMSKLTAQTYSPISFTLFDKTIATPKSMQYVCAFDFLLIYRINLSFIWMYTTSQLN